MAPSFSSPRQAGGFALLLAVILLLPALAGKPLLPPREAVYASAPDRLGPFPFLQKQIFKEKGDIDMVFMGSSHLWDGIDTPYVQKELSKKLGRDATVLTLGWPYPGFDALYFIAQDLLEHRKVHTLVINEESRGRDVPHAAASRWFRLGDCAGELSALPLQARAGFYADAVRGMPRNLLSLVRADLSVQETPIKTSFWESFYHAPAQALRLGSLSARLGFGNNPEFEEYTPQTSARPTDVCIYSQGNPAMFRFDREPATRGQDVFAQKTAALARKYGTRLIVLHLPETTEMRSPVIQERAFWLKTLSKDVTLMGIPPAKLFAGLKDEEVLKLFYDPGHLNKNGQEYFTKLITPCLLQSYAPIQN